jgi:hypothetical protein
MILKKNKKIVGSKSKINKGIMFVEEKNKKF